MLSNNAYCLVTADLSSVSPYSNSDAINVAGVNSVRQIRVRKNSISIAVEFQGERSEFVQRVLNHEKLPFAINLDKTEEGGLAFTVI